MLQHTTDLRPVRGTHAMRDEASRLSETELRAIARARGSCRDVARRFGIATVTAAVLRPGQLYPPRPRPGCDRAQNESVRF